MDAAAWVAVQQPFWQVLHVANNRRARCGGGHRRHCGRIRAYVLQGLSDDKLHQKPCRHDHVAGSYALLSPQGLLPGEAMGDAVPRKHVLRIPAVLLAF